MQECFTHASISAPYIKKIKGDRMPPWSSPDVNFTDSETDVAIYTCWLWPIRKDKNHLHVLLSNPWIFSFLQKVMGTVYHRLLTGPTPRFLFFCLLSFESTLVALTIEQSLLIFLPEPMLIFWQEFMHFHECVTCLHTIFLLFFPVLLMLLKAA